MKMIKLLIAIVVLVGCSTKPLNEVTVTHEVGNLLVTCVHKYDTSREFSYLKDNGKSYPITINGNVVVLFELVDTTGKTHIMNNLEAENYKCKTRPMDK